MAHSLHTVVGAEAVVLDSSVFVLNYCRDISIEPRPIYQAPACSREGFEESRTLLSSYSSTAGLGGAGLSLLFGGPPFGGPPIGGGGSAELVALGALSSSLLFSSPSLK